MPATGDRSYRGRTLVPIPDPAQEAPISIGLRPRSLGEILDAAFRLYKADFGLYFLTSILAAAPLAFLMILGYVSDDSSVAFGLVVMVLLPVAVVAWITLWPAISYQMDRRLHGAAPGVGEAWRWGIRRFFRVLWAWLLAYLMLVLLMIPTFILLGILGVLAGESTVGMGIWMFAIALFALALGGFWTGRVFLALPAMVAEDLSGFGSLTRAWGLSRKGWFGLSMLFGLVSVIWFAPTLGIYGVTGTFAMLWDPDAVSTGAVSVGALVAQQLLGTLAAGVTMPYFIAVMQVAYYDRRIRSEAYDLETATDALLSEA